MIYKLGVNWKYPVSSKYAHVVVYIPDLKELFW